jgi:hypothetical protein
MTDHQDALPAISRGIARTLVDGTIRITIEIEPRYALQAMAMLGMPGASIAVAGLAAAPDPDPDPEPDPEVEPAPEPEPTPEPPPLKGGPLAMSVGMLCNDPNFQEFVHLHTGHGPSRDVAAEYVRLFCRVSSRADLDHDNEARVRLQELMRQFRSFRNFETSRAA